MHILFFYSKNIFTTAEYAQYIKYDTGKGVKQIRFLHCKHLFVEKRLVVLTKFLEVQITIDFLQLNLASQVFYIDLNSIYVYV